MAALAVDPYASAGAGAGVIVVGDGVAGIPANTGQDAAGEVFGLAYQDAADWRLKAAAAGVNAFADC